LYRNHNPDGKSRFNWKKKMTKMGGKCVFFLHFFQQSKVDTILLETKEWKGTWLIQAMVAFSRA